MKTIISSLILLVFCTNNVYSQWIPITSPTFSSLYSVFFTDASTGYISGTTSGIVIKTTNGGTSWIFNNTGSGNSYYDMYFLNALTGFISGSTRQVVKTTNSGTNWDIVTSGSGTLYSISFPSSVAYGVGGSPASFIKSTDFGNNWTTLTAPSTNILRGAYFINGTVGWVCGDYGTIMYTTDGGFSWIPQNQSSSYTFEKLRIHSLTNGFICGSPGIMRTTNSGTNWFNVYSGGYIYDIYFLNSITGWGVGSAGKIVKSTDNGNTWLVQSSGVTSTLNAIHMANANTGYIVGSGGVLLKTTNGGGVITPPCFTKITNSPVVNDNSWSEGCAWGDYDNDGDQDLLVTSYKDGCSTCKYPLLLYRNDGSNNFTKITTGPVANEITSALGCAWGDYDNDSKLDLFVCTSYGQNNLLFHNLGNGNFEKIQTGSIVNDPSFSVACAWIDYNKDSFLDLFVVNHNNENDFLYQNNGNGTFTKVLAGPLVNDGTTGRSCTVADYDNDGWPDIFITCFLGQSNRLYHNNGGTFTLTSGVIPPDFVSSSGCAFADYDNDGWMDLFVTNWTTSNILYHNNGGTFSIVNSPVNETGNQSFGCTWIDYDNDGNLDLIVTNYNNLSFLYKNIGNGNFIKITSETMTQEISYGLGNSVSDINLDGKMDIFVANNGTSTAGYNDLLFINSCTGIGNYIGLKLKGCTSGSLKSNYSGIGARVKVKSGSKTYIKDLSTGTGFHSQNMLWLNFGLGSSSSIDSIIVNWPSGNVQKFSNIASNQYYLIDECLVGVISNNVEIPTSFSLLQNYPNPFNPSTTIEYWLLKSTYIKLLIYDINGEVIKVLVNSNQKPGIYKILIESQDLASGVYIYKLETNEFSDVKKMVLLK